MNTAGEARTILFVQGIARRFGNKEVLRDISFDGRQGTCIGITGLNGCGKSTLLSILAGVRKPEGGTFTCYGRDMFREKSFFSKLIAYVPQEDPLIEELSVRDNIRLWAGAEEFDRQLLSRMQLDDLLKEKVSSLSGGMKRRLAIACAMGRRRPVLIMDEPASALDLHQKDIIHSCLQTYLKQQGTIIMSTHDKDEICACSVLYYIENGTAVRADAQQVIARLREG